MPDRSSLEALLSAYSANDAEELGHQRRMLALLHAAGDPFARDHFEPGHFTASCFVLSDDGRRLLLIEHAKLRRWLQPGGHVEPDDRDIVAAARRELSEETRVRDAALEINGVFDLDVHMIPSFGAQPSHEHFDVRFLFRARDDQASAASDAKALRWVELAAVEEIDSDASVMRAVRKLLARTRKGVH